MTAFASLGMAHDFQVPVILKRHRSIESNFQIVRIGLNTQLILAEEKTARQTYWC